MITTTDRFNELCKALKIPEQGLIYHSWGDSTSVSTVFDKPSDSFELGPAVACFIQVNQPEPKHTVPDDYKGVVAVHRTLLSYSLVNRLMQGTWLECQLKTVSSLSPLINMGLVDLENNFGSFLPLRGFRLSLTHPDAPDVYVRELEDYAAYEIRIYLIKE